MDSKQLKIGITLGDPNGVGPETLIKIFRDSRMYEASVMVLYGSSKVMAFYKSTVEEADGVTFNVVRSAREAAPRKLNVVECGPDDLHITPGEATAEGGKAAMVWLQKAADELAEGAIDLLVTAPINKECMHSEGFAFTGHTEFLADRFGGEPLMLMCSDRLRVGLATIHLPVSEVAASLSQELIVKRLGQLSRSLKSDFGISSPRIAVLALNPHAGDGGLLGPEEQTIIKPAIVEAGGNGILAFGPFAADGFFAAGGYAKYDAVLAMYHDQGLTPFKTITPYGVNVTASLPIVRTSPDHGVGYDIAGKGEADESSMRNAIYMAADIFRSRRREAEYAANPLKHYEREKGRDVSVKDLKLPEQTDD